MSTPDLSKLNQNDVQGAALAILALNLTHPEVDDEYGELAGQALEEHCPLLGADWEDLTPEQVVMANAMMDEVLEMADRMEAEFPPMN